MCQSNFVVFQIRHRKKHPPLLQGRV